MGPMMRDKILANNKMPFKGLADTAFYRNTAEWGNMPARDVRSMSEVELQQYSTGHETDNDIYESALGFLIQELAKCSTAALKTVASKIQIKAGENQKQNAMKQVTKHIHKRHKNSSDTMNLDGVTAPQRIKQLKEQLWVCKFIHHKM